MPKRDDLTIADIVKRLEHVELQVRNLLRWRRDVSYYGRYEYDETHKASECRFEQINFSEKEDDTPIV